MIQCKRVDEMGVVINGKRKRQIIYVGPTVESDVNLEYQLSSRLVSKVHSRKVSTMMNSPTDKMSRFKSPPQELLSPKSKLKKKKKATKKKKKAIVLNMKTDVSKQKDRIDMLVGQSLDEFKKCKEQERIASQLKRERLCSMQELLKLMDFETRRMNAERFAKTRRGGEQLPWGIDQQKLKEYWGRMIGIHQKLQSPTAQQQYDRELKEQQRRQRLGLDFLNQLSDSIIQQVVIKQKQEDVKQTQQTQHMHTHSHSQQQLQSYITQKQQEWKNKKTHEKQLTIQKQHKLKQNLQHLHTQIQTQKNRQISLNSPNGRTQLNTLRKTSQTPKPQFDFNYLEHQQEQISNWKSTPKVVKNKTPTPQNQKFIEWLQNLPEAYLEQQLLEMQTINHEMNSQGYAYVLTEDEQYQFLEDFLKEKFRSQSRKISASSDVKKQLRNRHSELSERWKRQASERAAAIMIQKTWRGYHTRRMVFEYLQQEYEYEQQEYEQQESQNQSKKQSDISPLVIEECSALHFSQLSDVKGMVNRSAQVTPPLQTSQTKLWEELLREVSEFKESETNLSARARDLLNMLQKQGRANVRLLSEEDEQVTPQKHTQQTQKGEIGIQTDLSKSHTQENNEQNTCPQYQSDISQALILREQVIEQKYNEQQRVMHKLLENKKVSVESFRVNQERLERSIRRDRDKLGENRTELERMRKLFEDTVKLTKKDESLVEKLKRKGDRSIDDSIRQIMSLRTESDISDSEQPTVGMLLEPQHSPRQQQGGLDYIQQRCDIITEIVLQEAIEQFANELNQFPLHSLGVLMEWDEESIVVQSAVQPGFPTTLNFVKDYLLAFTDFIEKNHLDSFLQVINTPLGISPSDLLKTISLNDPQQLDESSSEPLYPLIKHIHMMEPVIDEEVWEKFNTHYAAHIKYAQTTDPELQDVQQSQHCHIRMIYDSFNQALNHMRPYGLRGQPYPWKCNSQKLFIQHTTHETIEKTMGFCIGKMLKWGAFLCGFIPEKIETPTGEVILIEDEYLNQIKEDRLNQMLENEIIENEVRWVNYEEELTEVNVELADIIFEMLLDEVSEEIHGIVR